MKNPVETLRGYRIKGRRGLQHWAPLLEEWLLVVERYCRVAAGEDAPFVYNERANIGLLAGAAWRSGSTALEEFQYGKSTNVGGRREWQGRVDLYMGTENQEEWAEAKFRWFSMRSGDRFHEAAESAMGDALTDAKAVRGRDRQSTYLAIAFLAPYLSVEGSVSLKDALAMMEKQIDLVDGDAVAWCFPREYRMVVSKKKNYTPGIVMIVRNIKYM